MSKVAIEGNASGTGTFTIAAPNSNSNYTMTLPTVSGTMMTTATSLDASQIPDGSITTAKIANANVTVAKLSATGTPSSSTFLRGDGSWQSPAGGVTSLNGETGAITNTTYGAIGSYTIAWSTSYNSTGQLWGPDVTVAGSTLTRASDTSFGYGASLNARGTFQVSVTTNTGSSSSLGLSGTWRCLTRQRNGDINSDTAARGIALWVRIS